MWGGGGANGVPCLSVEEEREERVRRGGGEKREETGGIKKSIITDIIRDLKMMITAS